MIKNLVQVILFTCSMLNACSHGHNSLERLEDFYGQIIWPVSVGQLPSLGTSNTLGHLLVPYTVACA